MNSFRRVADKVQHAMHRRGGSDAVVAAIAVLLFITSLGLIYVLNYVNGPTTHKNVYYTWEYIYSGSAAADTSIEWRSATAINPISGEKTGRFLHLRTTISASGQDRHIVVKTDHAPIKVSVNQKEVYNNWYGSADYVGNNYNAITIPASGSDTVVRISLRLPFSPQVQISLNENAASPFSMTAGGVLSAILLALGGIWLVISLVLLCTKRRGFFGVALACGWIVFSISTGLSALENSTYLYNAPEVYDIYMCVTYVLAALILLLIAGIFKIRFRPGILPLVLGLVPSVINCFLHAPAVYYAALVMHYGMLFVTAVILLKQSKNLLNHRIQNAKALNTVILYLAISFAATLVIQAFPRFRISLGSFSVIYSLVSLGFVVFCYVTSIYFDKEITKTVQIMQVYDACIEKIPLLIKKIIHEKDMPQIYRDITEGISDICVTFLGQGVEQDIAYCVAVRKNGGYDVILDENMAEKPNFGIIERRYLETGEACIFSQTYFCLIFQNADEIESMLYFEGLDGMLSSFFVKAIEIVYTVSNHILSGKLQVHDDERDVFVQLAKAVESNVNSNETHVDMVTKYTRLILQEMGYPEQTCELVSVAAALHDIGKIAIPDEITNKYGLLSDKERAIMDKHIEYGEKLLGSLDSEFTSTAAVIAAEHHEHYDGSGYHQKSGEEINIYARVVSVADVFDALTTKRSYKEAWSPADAIQYIRQNSGKNFDPQVVDAFVRVIGRLQEDRHEQS